MKHVKIVIGNGGVGRGERGFGGGGGVGRGLEWKGFSTKCKGDIQDKFLHSAELLPLSVSGFIFTFTIIK
jgi:hypothetical protein